MKKYDELDHERRIERLIANLANPASPCSRKVAQTFLCRLLQKKPFLGSHLKDEVSCIP